MIEIKTQSQFDSIVASTPTNQMILIYPRTDGEYYSLSQIWNIDSNTYIKGVGNPIIQYTGDTTFERYAQGAIMAKGTDETRKVNIYIKGITLLGQAGVDTFLVGIMGEHLGANEDRGSVLGNQGNHYPTDVGITNHTKTGMCIEDCTIKNFYSGIYLTASQCCKILSNTIEDAIEDGIYPVNSYAFLISDNFINNTHYPLYFTLSGEMSIYNNILQNATGTSLTLEQSELTTIKNNILTNSIDEAIYIHTSSNNNSVVGNQITHSVQEIGIDLENVEGNTVACNNVSNTWIGVSIYGNANHNSIHSNVLQNNEWAISNELNTYGNSIVGNVMTNNISGLWHDGADYSVYYGNVSNNDGGNLTIISGTGNIVDSNYNIIGGV